MWVNGRSVLPNAIGENQKKLYLNPTLWSQEEETLHENTTAHFEIHPAVEQDHQYVISEHESGSVLDINEKKNVRIIDHSDREWSTADHQLYSRNEELLFSKKTKHKSGRVVAINQDDDTVIAKELNRTSKENDQREQQRHHRVLLQKNLRRELRRSSKKHNQAQKKKYF